jgi:hypothetical protein
MPINKYQIAQSTYDNNNCVGRLIIDSEGNKSQTSTGHDILETVIQVSGALFQIPFAKEVFNTLDNIFCGPKCRTRRSNRAKGIGVITNYQRPTVF